MSEIRDRIVHEAASMVHTQGFRRTTLAQFAKAAEIPLGNFYYYFKTKESLGESLIEMRFAEYRTCIGEWEKQQSPRDRLLGFVRASKTAKEELTEFGCPLGSLTQELAKQGGPLAAKAGDIFQFLMDWVAQQFSAMGYETEAEAFALQLISSLQGTTLLANALARSALLPAEADRLSRWINDLAAKSIQRREP